MLDHYTGADWNVTGVVFDFIEPTKKGAYHRENVTVTPADVALVKEQIKTVGAKIQNHDFYTGCGKEDCHWCRFVKTNKLAVALHEIEENEPENVRMLLKTGVKGSFLKSMNASACYEVLKKLVLPVFDIFCLRFTNNLLL